MKKVILGGLVQFTNLMMALVAMASIRAQACDCAVTNVGSVSVPSVGSCVEYAGGPSLPCLDFMVTSVPGQPHPKPGKCIHEPACVVQQGEIHECVYSSRRFVVLAAPCAASCWSALSITVEYPNGQGVSIEPMSPGETIFIDAPAGAIPRACGTKEQSVYIKFYDELGALVFELRARYGCAQCKAKKAQ